MNGHARHEKSRLQDTESIVHASERKVIYWSPELPPFDAESMGEHIVEATSNHVPGTPAHRDELWDQCYKNVMNQAAMRRGRRTALLSENPGRVRGG